LIFTLSTGGGAGFDSAVFSFGIFTNDEGLRCSWAGGNFHCVGRSAAGVFRLVRRAAGFKFVAEFADKA
jgi:hypothetical protein